MNKKVLVTGGAGYIGSHTLLALDSAGYEVVILDDFSNSNPAILPRLEKIAGKSFVLLQGDLKDKEWVESVFAMNHFDAVLHFAGYKAVGESVAKPLLYYENNISGTVNLLQAMEKHGVKTFVFSSSATVYGDPEIIPIPEHAKTGGVTNPYGRTKLMIEEILQDLCISDPTWNVVALRYFNPLGAHESGTIGEDPNGIPNNLVPYVAKVAVGQLEKVHVFGDDYDTPDGTGVRDYIHVVDLALGHVKALDKLFEEHKGWSVYNLGTGRGYSVLEVIDNFKEASGKDIPFVIDPRRPGDIATSIANPAKAEEELNWKAEKEMSDMCKDTWKWQSQNPKGFKS